MSVFNPEQFMQTEVNSELSTSIIPIPIGEYVAQIDKVEKPVERKVGDDMRWIMDVHWAITDPKAIEATKREKPSVKQGVFLDITEAGGIDTSEGANVGLGRLLAATGLNKSGWSPAKLVGKRAKIKVKHTPNPNDPKSPYSNMDGDPVKA